MSLRDLAARLMPSRYICQPPVDPPPGTTHVIQYRSPLLLSPSDRDPGMVGWWNIQTFANHEAGTPADGQPDMEGGPETPAAMLAFFAAGVLGCEVTLTYFDEEVMVSDDYPHGEWLPAPAYYVTPAGGDR